MIPQLSKLLYCDIRSKKDISSFRDVLEMVGGFCETAC